MEKELTVKCDCQSHAIQFEYEEESQSIEITIWQRNQPQSPFSFKERIRWCWNVLLTGKPWGDRVILSQDKADQITKFLTDLKQK